MPLLPLPLLPRTGIDVNVATRVDDYARQVMRAGVDVGVGPRGIVIAFATVFVESNWLMYANRADPESLSFPHDAVGSDANSVGLFQQRAEWWGTCAQRMDAYESAKMFFEKLKRYPYASGHWGTPGYWAQKVQGSAFPDRYETRIAEAQRLYDRLSGSPARSGVEKKLNYSRSAIGEYDGVAQQRSWDCGPASAQIILQSVGVKKTEQYLIDRIGTTTAGTNHAGLITPILNELIPGANYKAVALTTEPVPQAQVDRLWNDCKKSIDGGHGVIFNFVAPPSNFPRATRGDTSPEYRGYNTIYHYVAGMGYADDGPGGRHFWIADPGFRPFGYWCSLQQVATLIVPHMYAFDANAKASVETPQQPNVVAVDRVSFLEAAWSALEFGDAESIAVVVKANNATSRKVVAKLEKDNPDALRAYLQSRG